MDQPLKTEGKSHRLCKIKIFFLVMCSLFFVSGSIGFGWCWSKYESLYRSIDINSLSKEPPKPAVFYDRDGGVITELTNAKMEYTPLDQFPRAMLDAIIAVEDARFYEHNGVDFYAIARAFYRNLRSGEKVQGGSTITQQLAKTLLFTKEQTYSRKLNEAVASVKIENTYTKNQILELYLNYIYFGEGAYGLQRASQVYFGKNASELTLAECAMMAGIPKSPTNYSPVNKPDQSKARRNLVLNMMAEQAKINAEQRDAAKAEPINLAFKTALKTTASYPSSYVDHVMNEAVAKFGLTEQQILSSGLQIYTNMDPKVQAAAEEVYKEPSYFPKDNGGLQSGIVLMAPKTGAVLGLVGSRNANKEYRGFNFATQNERQPGSSIKPIMVYAPALNAGFGPRDLINDVETEFASGYKPMNYKKEQHGWVTLEEALIQSYNIPAVAMLKEIGIDKGMELAKKTGLPLQDSDRTLGIALGGMSKGTSPLAMAQAYTMFANEGNIAEAYAITKIADKHGNVVAEAQPKLRPVLDPTVAYTMTKMMEKVVTEGTGQSARFNRPVAGKTGTTQLPDIAEFKDKYGNQIDGSKDAWFVGYTPEIVAAVWLGYEKTNRGHYLTTTGGKYPASLFKEVLSRALKDMPVTVFPPPESYRAVAGGSKRINGDKETLLASLYKDKLKTQQPAEMTEPETAASAEPSGAEKQAENAAVNDPNKSTDPKNPSGQKVQTAGTGPAQTGTAGSSSRVQTAGDTSTTGSAPGTAAKAAESGNKNDSGDAAKTTNLGPDPAVPAGSINPGAANGSTQPTMKSDGGKAAESGSNTNPTERKTSPPAGTSSGNAPSGGANNTREGAGAAKPAGSPLPAPAPATAPPPAPAGAAKASPTPSAAPAPAAEKQEPGTNSVTAADASRTKTP